MRRLLISALLCTACSGTPDPTSGTDDLDRELTAPREATGSVSLHPDGATPPLAGLVEAAARELGVDRTRAGWRSRVPAPPPSLRLDAQTRYEWQLDTDIGTLRIELLPRVAPKHVTSTVWLTTLGFYDGLVFHRVIPGFMAQGGCPEGRGTGGPGYSYGGEFPTGAPLHTGRGVLSMANAGPGTDGSQFFLTFAATPWLDGRHTVFGRVVDGAEVLRALEAVGTESGAPTRTVHIRHAQIVTTPAR